MKRGCKRALGALMAISTVAIFFGPSADAGQSSTTFTVSATVFDACSFTTSNMVFPGYASGGVDTFTTAPFTITCPGAGTGTPAYLPPVRFQFATSNSLFQMSDGAGGTLNYDICDDPACNSPYSNGTPGPWFGVDTVPYVYNLTGHIPASQNSPPGNYSQTVTATMFF